jgi:hypothetical protein
MKGETVSELSLHLYYLKSHCDKTTPACLDMFLHVLSLQELNAATPSDTSSNMNSSACFMWHICDV